MTKKFTESELILESDYKSLDSLNKAIKLPSSADQFELSSKKLQAQETEAITNAQVAANTVWELALRLRDSLELLTDIDHKTIPV